MALKAKHFALHELVCDHIIYKYGDVAWQFIDPRLIITMDWIREETGRPIYVNNYAWDGHQTQSGVRCNVCDLELAIALSAELYMSAHPQGQACDFHIRSMNTAEALKWIEQHEKELPYPIRLEKYVDWVHLDVRDTGQKIYLFRK